MLKSSEKKARSKRFGKCNRFDISLLSFIWSHHILFHGRYVLQMDELKIQA